MHFLDISDVSLEFRNSFCLQKIARNLYLNFIDTDVHKIITEGVFLYRQLEIGMLRRK